MDADPRLLAWVAAQLGPTRGWTRLDHRGGSSRVFGLADADGGGWIVKQFRSARGFEQERRALSQWLAGRSELGGVRVPRLRAAEPRLAALIVERLAGEPVDARGGGVHVQRAAGRFLAGLHELELDDDDAVPLAAALERRTRAWLDRGAFEPELVSIVERFGPRPELFADARRVACHRDFAPRNWLWDGASLAVFDFEHARMDLGLVDLAKLQVDCWSRDPSLAQAFFSGFGRALTDLERDQLRALVVLHGLASLAWGREHGAAVHVAEGLRALRLAAAASP